MSNTNWRPTRKWWATQITATTTLTVAWVNAGHWNKSLTVAAIGLVSQALVVYLVPNADSSSRTGTTQPAAPQRAGA
ncbi:MAG: hypothetical protein J2P22_10090 [Nocardioides sp.]|nr:hypothetical protein [Nocardioides sp.]